MLNRKAPQNTTQNTPPPMFPLTTAIAIAVHGQCPFDFLTDTLLSILLSILNPFPLSLSFTTEPWDCDCVPHNWSRYPGIVISRPLFDLELSMCPNYGSVLTARVPIIRSCRPLLLLNPDSIHKLLNPPTIQKLSSQILRYSSRVLLWLWRGLFKRQAQITNKNIERIANAVQCHSWLSGNKDGHEFRLSIVRTVISVSNVTSFQDCLFNCQNGKNNCQNWQNLSQLSKL